MTLQIKELVLYRELGPEMRLVDFEIGEVNVITGGKDRGKSALIHIIDWCFGRDKYGMPKSAEFDSVGWFGVRVISADKSQLVIIRRNKKHGAEIYFELGGNLSFPPKDQLSGNISVEGLVRLLGQFVGLERYTNVPPPGQTRSPVAVGFQHTQFFLFQDVDIIGNKKNLFYRANEQWMPQAIKDVLPFFMGAISSGDFADREELKRVRQKIRYREYRLEQAKDSMLRVGDVAQRLVEASYNAGLLDSRAVYDTDDSVELVRRAIANFENGQYTDRSDSVRDDDHLSALEEERVSIYSKYRQEKEKLSLIRSLATEQGYYANELNEQRGRLASIGLFDSRSSEPMRCPVCGTDVHRKDVLATAIGESLQRLSDQLDALRVHPSYASEWLAQQESVVENQLDELRGIRKRFAAAKEVEEQRMHSTSEAEVRAHVAGQAQRFIDDLAEADGVSAYGDELDTLYAREAELKERVGEQKLRERMHEGLHFVNSRIEEFARAVGLNYSDRSIEFDSTRLALEALDADGEKVTLQEMGGHATSVGYHISLMLALHALFVKNDSAVPRFIIFDQPSLPYYSPDKGVVLDKDEDRESLILLFREIVRVVSDFDGALQVIILEHADFDEPFFLQTVRQRWRGKDALIPESWYTDSV